MPVTRLALLAGLLVALTASAQSLLRYPGDRAVRASSVTATGGTNRFVAAVGDSNTEGFGLLPADSYPGKLEGLLGFPWQVDNVGVGGTRCPQVLTRYGSHVQGKGYGTVVVMCGTNDIRLTSDDAATIYANVRAVWLAAKADGLNVIAITILPAGTADGYTADMEARRVAVNASIIASSGVTVINAEVAMGDHAAPAMPRLKDSHDLGDGLHISQAGANALAALVYDALTP